MEPMPRNTIEALRTMGLAICLLIPSAVHAAESERFAGDLICSTGQPVKNAGVPELTLPSISMELKCGFRKSGTGESATYTGVIKLAQVTFCSDSSYLYLAGQSSVQSRKLDLFTCSAV